MDRLNTVEEFVNFRIRIQSDAAIDYGRLTLVVCAGTGGQASGSNMNNLLCIKTQIPCLHKPDLALHGEDPNKQDHCR